MVHDHTGQQLAYVLFRGRARPAPTKLLDDYRSYCGADCLYLLANVVKLYVSEIVRSPEVR